MSLASHQVVDSPATAPRARPADVPPAIRPSPLGLSASPPRPDDGRAGAILTFAAALPAGLAAFSAVALAWQGAAPQPFRFAGFTIDRLSAALSFLVAALGWTTYRFSVRHLHGDPHRGRFLRRLLFTIVCAYVLMLSTHLLWLLAAWSATSLGLHQLLTHYPDRAEAARAARKKFLISRLGDAALLAAAAVIAWNWRTLDLNRFIAAAVIEPAGGATTAAAMLIVLAALTKSAQFPFHSWLPETMESPTPVSALMHAGVINAGGALLLRLAPAVALSPAALLTLSLVGTLTATLGVVCMWAQVKVKRRLAWSTVSQMGFMMVQCGVAAFAAALLHITAHGCYKAWSFLRSGELPAASGAMRPLPPGMTLAIAAAGAVAAAPMMAAASWLTGFSPLHSLGEAALAAILALSCGQLWVALLADAPITLRKVASAAVVAFTAVIAAFGLYAGAAAFLEPVVGRFTAPAGWIGRIAAAAPVIGMLLLVVLHAFLPRLDRSRTGRAFRVHALNGFYFGTLADRAVEWTWSRLPSVGGSNRG